MGFGISNLFSAFFEWLSDQLMETFIFYMNWKNIFGVMECIHSIPGLLLSKSIYFNCGVGFWITFYLGNSRPIPIVVQGEKNERSFPRALE
ncbi:hypothetical protein MSWHS_2371 [Methanosarcina sp. WWM596]|nr:hypothetical protein MSWHS_2371 [Methanosarcina sp. WWM596]AKB22936.1 hypothetical protein MSWH1_2665 [Methanosarcina sp. WH1]